MSCAVLNFERRNGGTKTLQFEWEIYIARIWDQVELAEGNRSLLGRLLVGRGFLIKDNFLRFRYKTEKQSDSLCEY